MESDEEEGPSVYEETNQDLVRLLDSYSSGPGGVKSRHGRAPTYACDRSRVVRLGAAHNTTWYRALAGALGIERMEELYDSDDVTHGAAQCQRRVDHKTRARHRESAEETRLRDELHRLQGDAARAATTLEYTELAAVPPRLIQVWLQLRQTRQDLALVSGATDGDADRLKIRMAQFREWVRLPETEDDVEEARQQFGGDAQRRDAAAFTPLTLFTLYWDNARFTETSLHSLLSVASQTLRETVDQVYALRPVLLPGQPAQPRPVIPPPRPVARPLGTETVDLAQVQACYDALQENGSALQRMVRRGAHLAYGAHMDGAYVRLVDAYLWPERARPGDDPLKRLNIFASSADDEAGHPPPVWRAVRALLPPSVQEYDERTDTPTRLRQALQAHFLWCYMTRASITRLALDWDADGEAPPGDGRADVEHALHAVQLALGEYYSLVASLLLDRARSPFLQHDAAGEPLFRLPMQMRAHDFSATAPLDRLNALFGTHTSVLDLVQSAELRRRVSASGDAIAYFGALRYPVLALFGVLDLYMQLTRDTAAPLLRQKVTEAESALARLLTARQHENDQEDEDEDDDMDVAAPRLRPDIEAAVQLAYNKVQRFCKGLAKLPRAQLEAQHAAESGLQSDFLVFVRALADERGLLRAKGYRSRYQMRGAMMTTTEALYTLKHYHYRRLGVHRYRTYRT